MGELTGVWIPVPALMRQARGGDDGRDVGCRGRVGLALSAAFPGKADGSLPPQGRRRRVCFGCRSSMGELTGVWIPIPALMRQARGGDDGRDVGCRGRVGLALSAAFPGKADGSLPPQGRRRRVCFGCRSSMGELTGVWIPIPALMRQARGGDDGRDVGCRGRVGLALSTAFPGKADGSLPPQGRRGEVVLAVAGGECARIKFRAI